MTKEAFEKASKLMERIETLELLKESAARGSSYKFAVKRFNNIDDDQYFYYFISDSEFNDAISDVMNKFIAKYNDQLAKM